MQNFIYHNPTKVVFGKAAISKLSKVLPTNKKVLVLYGGGSIKKNGVYDQLTEQLKETNWVEFSGIEANPEYTTLMRAVDLAKTEQIEFILAVGGGSVVDGAKFVAAAINVEGDAEEILNNSSVVKSAVPMGCILTLPATGSETNTASVVNISEKQAKKAFMSEHVRPLFAILDPEVTYSLPDRQLANGVADAFVHVVEQYLTYPVNAMVQDRFAESILQNLIELGPKVKETDYEVMANLMWNATQALSGLIGAGVPQDWSTHMIGHQLTALYGLDHAVTLAIVLPRLLKSQQAEKRAKLLQYAERVWGISSEDENLAIEQAITKTEQFFRELGIKTKLSEHDIDATAEDKVAHLLETQGLTALGEHGKVDVSTAKQIIAASI